MLTKTKLKIVACLSLITVVLVGCGSGSIPTNGSTASEATSTASTATSTSSAAISTANAAASTGIAAQSVETTIKSKKPITIGFAEFNSSINTYCTLYDKWFRENAQKTGVKTVVLDALGDPLKQNQQMDSLIQQKVDVIILWPANAQTVLPKIKKAKDAGIPVIITNSPVDATGVPFITAYTGADNRAEGKMAAEMLVEALNGKGKVVEVTGLPGYQTTIDRSEGFHEEMAKHPGMEIIDVQPGDWVASKAQKVTEDMATKHPQIDGLYAATDDMAVGAINALKDAGRIDKVKVVSACFFAVGYDAMKNGQLYGSIWQSALGDAKIALETAIKLGNGENVPKNNNFDTPKVTKANIDQFGKPPF
jgi:ribose transport system substrate-binding protein